MKKFFKYLFISIIIICFLLGSLLFIFRNKVSLYINVGKQYLKIKDTPLSSNDISSFSNPIDSIDFKDIIYKNTNNTPLTLDIYSSRKKLSKGSPVILYVHGGSWVYGDKVIPDAISPLLDVFRNEGFTIISTSYELMRKNVNFQKQISDIKDTLRWINKNKETYGFNTDEIGILGTSSGAHLSLMAAYSDDKDFGDDKDLINYSSKVKYIIDFFGPTDLTSLDMNKAGSDLNKAINATINPKEIMSKFSPINYVKDNLPSTLIVHSKLDEVVPFSNSTYLYEELKKHNNKVDLLPLENSGHDLSNISKNDIVSLASKLLHFIIRNSSI